MRIRLRPLLGKPTDYDTLSPYFSLYWFSPGISVRIPFPRVDIGFLSVCEAPGSPSVYSHASDERCGLQRVWVSMEERALLDYILHMLYYDYG